MRLLAIFALLLASLALVDPALGDAELVMIVHRHGARTVLVKNATSLAEGGASLTAQGADQLRTIGQNFRRQYLDGSTCGDRCISALPRGSYDGTRVRVISSGFDRTLASAISFGQGAFPVADGNLPNPIPVYSTPPPDDWLIRAYENCPAYLKKMNAFFESPEFAAYEKQVAPLMAKLTEIRGTNTTLVNFWNTFDELNTERDAVLLDSRLTLNPALSEPIWPQVVATADWLESHRYSRAVVGNLIGGSLLNELLYRLDARIANMQPAAQRLIEYSAHYPTILALLATLPLAENATVFLSKIPNYGALLALELHKTSGGGYALAMRAQDGANATYAAVPLPCAEAGDAAEQAAGVGACSYPLFRDMAAEAAIVTQGRWCAVCNNTKMDACVGIRADPALDNPATYDFTLNKTAAASGAGTGSGAGAGTGTGTGGGFCAGLDAAPASTDNDASTTSGSGRGNDAAGKIAGAAVGGAVGAALLTAAVLTVPSAPVTVIFRRKLRQAGAAARDHPQLALQKEEVV